MDRQVSFISVIVGLALFLSVGYMFYEFIGAISLGIFIYYSTRPFYKKLVDQGVNATVAATVSQFVIIIPVLLLLAYTIRILAIEVRSLAIRAGGSLFSFLNQEFFKSFIEERARFLPEIFPSPSEIEDFNFSAIIQRIRDNIDPETINTLSDSATEIIISVTSSVSGAFFILFIAFSLSFYLLRDGSRIRKIVFETLNYDRTAINYLKTVDSNLRVVFFGNILLAIVTAVFGAVLFTLLSIFIPGGELLAYPALIGVLCGLGSLIPVIGMKIVYVPVVIGLYVTALINGTFPSSMIFPTTFLVVAAVFIDFIPDLLARPYFGGRGGISTGLLLFSYILGPLVLGWYGLFLGPLLFVAFYQFILIVVPVILEENSFLDKDS